MARYFMSLLDDVVEFCIKYMPWENKNPTEVKDVIQKHIEYGTILIIKDEGVSAVVRWNWVDEDNRVAKILDCAVRPDKRSLTYLKSILKFGVDKFNAKSLVWDRTKYKGRPMKEYKEKRWAART